MYSRVALDAPTQTWTLHHHLWTLVHSVVWLGISWTLVAITQMAQTESTTYSTMYYIYEGRQRQRRANHSRWVPRCSVFYFLCPRSVYMLLAIRISFVSFVSMALYFNTSTFTFANEVTFSSCKVRRYAFAACIWKWY